MPEPPRHPGPVLLLLLALGGALLAAPTAGAQVLRLGDDDEWETVESVEPGTPEARLLQIRRLLAEGRNERAELLASQWIELHPDHPRVAEAHLIRGDSLHARREYYRALFDYELIARAHPGSDAFVVALERELDIARRFLSGTKRKLWGLRIADAKDEAEELMIRIQERLPGSWLAEQAAIELADHYFKTARMSLAADMYAIFLENHPRSDYARRARTRLIASHLAAFKGPEFDARGLIEARLRLEELEIVAPATAAEVGSGALLARIEESLANKQLVTARWYARSGDPVAAEFTIRRLVERYPGTVAAYRGAEFAVTLLPDLPPRVRDGAPDYAALLAPAAPDEDVDG